MTNKSVLLFNTDLEVLFTTTSVDEIERLSQGVKHDIDRKREELRMMVGERYRDLMEAADTISQMKTSSEAVIVNMKSVIQSSNELQSMAFTSRTTGRETRSAYQANNLNDMKDADKLSSHDGDNDQEAIDEHQVALAAQIKLLTDAPEKMWAAVEQADYLLATQLYLFARHIHTSLMLNDVEGSVTSAFPVIDRQWAAISHFHEAILNGCRTDLAASSTTPDKAVETLAAMVFLRGLNANSLLKEFLKLRENSLQDFLRMEGRQSAKAYIGQTLTSMISFLRTLHRAFVTQEDGKSQLEKKLESVSTTPTFQLFNATGFSSFSTPVMRYLPQIIRDFTPSIISVDSVTPNSKTMKQKVDLDLVKRECTQWLDRMHDIISERTSVILEHVNTIAGLSMIRKTIYQALAKDLLESDWELLCMGTLSRKLSLWDEFYRNLFLDRVEALIDARISDACTQVLGTLTTSTEKESSSSIVDFIWSEAAIQTSAPDPSRHDTNNNNILSMKTKAYSPSVQHICQQLNNSLVKLLKELDDYVRGSRSKEDENHQECHNPLAFLNDANDKSETEPFSLSADNETILKFAQRTCIEAINRLVSDVSKARPTDNAIELGRMFLAMTELCPAIQKCVEANQLLSLGDTRSGFGMTSSSTSRTSSEWTQVKKILEDESHRYFMTWLEQLVSSLRLDLDSFLANDNLGLCALAEWETKEISEVGEDGAAVRSIICIPQYISIGLHVALAGLVARAHASGPHALPQAVQLALTQEVASAVAESYIRFSDRKLMQTIALQLYFDIQFVTQMMLTRDSKSLNTLCSNAMTSLEKHIDPFDMSVFSPHMSEHVKRTVIRCQTIFGILIPSDRFTVLSTLKTSSITTSSTGSGDQQQHNVIRMTSTGFRFPLLPVSSMATGPGRRGRPVRDLYPDTSGVDQKLLSVAQTPAATSSRSSSSSRPRSKSPTPSRTSTSFFGSMGSSWFGGK